MHKTYLATIEIVSNLLRNKKFNKDPLNNQHLYHKLRLIKMTKSKELYDLAHENNTAVIQNLIK